MTFFSLLLAVTASLTCTVEAQKYVFAHVVVGDTYSHTQATWENDITLAHDAGIDAFALNIGYPNNFANQVSNAFAAAEALNNGFKLFFSFDYLGGGQPWPATGDSSVVSYLTQYQGNSAYFNYNSASFVSTFEGPSNSADWARGGPIRSAVSPVYFVPDWTSVGPGSIGPYLAGLDGVFSWDMWPVGANNETDSSDLAWQSAIGSKTYMMGVSPWFFHSAIPTAGNPDWVWRGDDLWHDRWQETLSVKPEFVEIVTWNDYGESHYIGPPPTSTSEIPAGSAPYVANMPHDSWRDFLPYYISAYKGTPFAITRDQMQFWYRLAPAAGGSPCGVLGNNPDQGQTEVDPNTIVEDAVFFSALLMADANVTVQIGSDAAVTYAGVEGINHWSQPFSGQTGAVTVAVIRDGEQVNSRTGPAITPTTNLANGCTNYNAWVGSF